MRASWHPKGSMETDEGIQSAAIGLRHEIDHAAENDRTGVEVKRDAHGNLTPESAREEARATADETKTAIKLNEPTRKTYDEGRAAPVPNSTYSCKKSNENRCD